jgi:hypothetical protein
MMNKKRLILLVLIISFVTRIFALDDIPVYLDADCPNSGIPKSFAQGPSDMLIAGSTTKIIPITCTEALTGTDAMEIKLDRNLKSGEYWDFILKFADDTQKRIGKFTDLRLMVKNKISNPAKFRLMFELSNYQPSQSVDVVVPANQEWKELVFPLSSMGISSSGDSVNGVKFSNPLGQYNGPDLTAGPIDLLIDSVRITDGTGNGTIRYPAKGTGPLPAGWPSTFVAGSYDNFTIGTGTEKLQGKIDYRYQYIMHETWTWAKDIGKTYSDDCNKIGVKAAFVWYYLGKASESEVAQNLLSATFMTTYFDEYDSLLNGMARAALSNYIIVLEPDMYGLLMQKGLVKDMDGANLPVNMDRANTLSGKIWPANMKGWAQYMISRAKQKLPKGVIIGHMLNHWGVNIPGFIGNGRKEAHIMGALAQGNFINSLGPEGKGDLIFIEKRDRDAGTAGPEWFWDSSNYAKYFLWTKLLSTRTNLRIAGWQVSEGNMNHPVVTNRDDAVQYFMDHPQQWVDAGFIGILFGPGMAGQADYTNDNGWFLSQMDKYQKSRIPVESINKIKIIKNENTKSPVVSLMYSNSGIFFTGFTGKATVECFNVQGKRFLTQNIYSGEKISVTGLASNLYIVRLKSGMGEYSFTVRRQY